MRSRKLGHFILVMKFLLPSHGGILLQALEGTLILGGAWFSCWVCAFFSHCCSWPKSGIVTHLKTSCDGSEELHSYVSWQMSASNIPPVLPANAVLQKFCKHAVFIEHDNVPPLESWSGVSSAFCCIKQQKDGRDCPFSWVHCSPWKAPTGWRRSWV